MVAMAERGNNKTADAAAGKEQTPPAPERKFWMQSSTGAVWNSAQI
jgi:hypothetical protein